MADFSTADCRELASRAASLSDAVHVLHSLRGAADAVHSIDARAVLLQQLAGGLRRCEQWLDSVRVQLASMRGDYDAGEVVDLADDGTDPIAEAIDRG